MNNPLVKNNDIVKVQNLKKKLQAREPEQKCRICGCTDIDCRHCIEAQGHPCHWVEEDLCNRCAEELKIHLPCGCIEGQFDCPEAEKLWAKVMEDFNNKNYDRYNKAKMEYEKHRNFKADRPLYIDKQDRSLFISQGIGNHEWGIFWRKSSGSLARIKSTLLPMRPTREEAERDLHEQARRKGWTPCN